jgi:peptide/nickel transport system permease protein
VQRYILIRLAQSVLTLLIISIVVFGLARLSGDPINVLTSDDMSEQDLQQVKENWGLDKSYPEQYWLFLANAVQGDFGKSLRFKGHTAISLIKRRLPATLELTAVALGFGVLLAIPIGVLSAVKKDTPFDYGAKIFGLLGQSVPSFWLGIVLIWVFGVTLGWLPVSLRDEGNIFQRLDHIVLPAFTLGYFSVAALMRLTRSAMLEVLDSEYVKLARIKGLPEWKVIWKHCLRNAAIAPLTYFGLVAGFLLTGSVVTETVFAWPGTGLLAVEAVQARDYQVVQAVVLFMASIFIASNLVVDVLYAYLDPRIRYN